MTDVASLAFGLAVLGALVYLGGYSWRHALQREPGLRVFAPFSAALFMAGLLLPGTSPLRPAMVLVGTLGISAVTWVYLYRGRSIR